MKCPKCRFEVTEEAKFCSECGYDLRSVQGAAPTDYSQPHTYTPKFLADEKMGSHLHLSFRILSTLGHDSFPIQIPVQYP